MAFKLGKYVSIRYAAVEDPATREALQDVAARVRSLAQDTNTTASAGDVPSGGILLWDTANPDGTYSCPIGYTEVMALRNAFPRGWNGTAAQQTGGSATHAHGGTTGNPSTTYVEIDGAATSHNVADALHTHTVTTDTQSNVPPYYTLLYCRKL